MKLRIVPVLVLLLGLAGCGAKAPQPFVCYLPVSDTLIASVDGKILYIANDTKSFTNIAYERASCEGNTLVLLSKGKLYGVHSDGVRLIETELRAGQNGTVIDGKLYVKTRNLVSVISNGRALTGYALPYDYEELGVWNDVFFVARKGAELKIFQRAAPGSTILTERSKIEGIADFAVASEAPIVFFVMTNGLEVKAMNLYSGAVETKVSMPTPIMKIRYYEANKLLIVIGKDYVAFQHLDSGRLEMGSLNAIDAFYDPSGNRVFVLTPRSVMLVENLSRLIDQASLAVKEYTFE